MIYIFKFSRLWAGDENCICTCTENTFLSHRSTFIISSQFVNSDIHMNKYVNDFLKNILNIKFLFQINYLIFYGFLELSLVLGL